MVTGRHIDTDARMIWQTVAQPGRAMTAAQVRAYWSPTFTASEVQDALQRLVAGHHLEAADRRNEQIYFVSSGCMPLPGFEGVQRQ